MATLVSIWASLNEHCRRVARYWWALIISGIGAVLGIISLTVSRTQSSRPMISVAVWLSLLFGGILVAQFLAFHDVRREHDAARADLTTRFDHMRYRLRMTEVQAFIGERFLDGASSTGEPGYSMTLEFTNGASEAMEYRIESMTMQFGGHTTKEPWLYSISEVLPPGHTGRFVYPWIDAPTQPLQGGKCEFVIAYGHPTADRWFRFQQQLQIQWMIRPNVDPEPLATTVGDVVHEPFTRAMA